MRDRQCSLRLSSRTVSGHTPPPRSLQRYGPGACNGVVGNPARAIRSWSGRRGPGAVSGQSPPRLADYVEEIVPEWGLCSGELHDGELQRDPARRSFSAQDPEHAKHRLVAQTQLILHAPRGHVARPNGLEGGVQLGLDAPIARGRSRPDLDPWEAQRERRFRPCDGLGQAVRRASTAAELDASSSGTSRRMIGAPSISSRRMVSRCLRGRWRRH